MSVNKNKQEQEIANDFSSLFSIEEKKEYIKNIPRNIKANKVQEFLNSDSDRAQFSRFYFGREKMMDKGIRNYKKRRNELIKGLRRSKSNYKAAKYFMNPLRKKGEDLLRKEALVFLIKRKNKYLTFYQDIAKAENIADLIKQKNLLGEELKDLLLQNIESLINNDVILKSLKDLFEFDIALNVSYKDFNDFIVTNIESKKNIDEVITDAEEKLINGDITKAYQEIEKTEQLIEHNIGQALMDVYNSINVMAAKKEFVQYIEKFENNIIPKDKIEYLLTKSNEYRNVVLPKKWDEMQIKCASTHQISHFKAWLFGLKEGRYKTVVANVKEYIVKEIIKKILSNIVKKFSEADLSGLNLVTLLDSKVKDLKSIKEDFKELFSIPEIKKGKDNELIIHLKQYRDYFLLLNSELSDEKDIILNILEEFKSKSDIKSKLIFLEKSKGRIKKETKNEDLSNVLDNVINKLIKLYSILNEIENEKGKADELRSEPISKTIAFLNELYNDIEKKKKVDVKQRIKSLSDNIDVMTILKLDPRFEKYYPEVEDSLYFKEWGRTLGIIGIKVKQVEKKLGMLASEEYLEDLAKRLSVKLGKDSFVVKKIKNMKDNLIKLHEVGTKKLHFIQEKLSKSRNSAEKIIELQRISRNPRFIGVFGTIQNMERILIRDKFDIIYDKVKYLPIDTQKTIFMGVKEDLESLLKYDPDVVIKVNNYIKEINSILNRAAKEPPKASNKTADSLESFEKGELPLVDLAEVMDIQMPSEGSYSSDKVKNDINELQHEINIGSKHISDLDALKSNINNDISLYKLTNDNEAKQKIEEANKLLNEVSRGFEQIKDVQEYKTSKNIKRSVYKIMNNENSKLSEKIDLMENVAKEKDLDQNEKGKIFKIASGAVKDKKVKSDLLQIVDVIRRIEKEIDPLYTLNSKISAMESWKENEYSEQEYIKDFLDHEIKDLALLQGREGGLLRKILEGLEIAENKIKYLNQVLKDPEFKHLKPMINNLIENIKEEEGIKEEDISEEFIVNKLEDKENDEKLGWLKIRKYWNKYEKYKNVIDNEMDKIENKISKKASEGIKIYEDIIDLAEAVVQTQGVAARQKLIKSQDDDDDMFDGKIKGERKLLFYLMSSEKDESRERIKSLIKRVKLSISDKQKYLQLLKNTKVQGKGSLKNVLKISDDDIAFFAAFIISLDKPIDIRIKHIERFRDSDEPKAVKYKDFFEITDKIASDVINELRASTKKAQEIPEKDIEILEKETIEKKSLVIEDQEASDIEELESVTEKKEEIEEISIDIVKNVGTEDEEEIEEIQTEEAVESKDPSIKSTEQIIKEQKLRDDYEKREKIADHIKQMAEKSSKKDVAQIKEKAQELKDDKQKKVELKISELLAFLSTCYPEAISKILSDEILPVFHGEGLDLDVYKILESLNNSVFQPALIGKDVIESATFFKDKLNNENYLNVLNIIEKIKDLWKKESKKLDEQEEGLGKALEEIGEGKGIISILRYLNLLYSEDILPEIKNNLAPNIKDQKLKDKLLFLYTELNSILEKGTIDKREKRLFIKRLELKDENEKYFEELISKMMAQSGKEEEPPTSEVSTAGPSRSPDVMVDNKREDIEKKPDEEEDKIEIDPVIENALVNLNDFIKPHAFIVDVVKNKGLRVKDYNVDIRRNIVNNLFNRGKIFTYNGTAYIGSGKINALVNNDKIPKLERETFVNKLDVFLSKMPSVEAKMTFLGVKDETEFRKLNYLLDKYNVNRQVRKESQGLRKSSIPKGEQESEDVKMQSSLTQKENVPSNVVDIEDLGKLKERDYRREQKEKKSQKFSQIQNAKIKRRREQEKQQQLSAAELKKKTDKFFSETKRKVLKEATKEINKRLERLIKSSLNIKDLENIKRNYLGNSGEIKRNLLSLCYERKRIAEIIKTDKDLFSILSYDNNKIDKLYNSMSKKLKK